MHSSAGKKMEKKDKALQELNQHNDLNAFTVRARAWRIVLLVLCTIGVLLSADLLRLHVKVHTDPDYHSYCAISERVNCETVALSSYSVLWGLPLAIWGLLGYAAMGGLCIWGLRQRLLTQSWPVGLLFWISAMASLGAIALYVISHFLIHSVCIVCLGTYAVSWLLLVVSAIDLRRISTGPIRALVSEVRALLSSPTAMILYLALFGLVALILQVVVPSYWKIDVAIGPDGLHVGQTPQGHQWIGSRNPMVEIEEFSDYQCPHCNRGHKKMRQIVKSYPNRLRLVHRHFPLSRHRHAFTYSVLASCAGDQNKFWEANDFLFANGRRNVPVTATELAAELGLDAEVLQQCSRDPKRIEFVRNDIRAGKAMGIRGTPSFVMHKTVYPGGIPPDVLRKALGLTQPAAD